MTQIITSITTVIGVLIMMFSISWLMTLAALVILPISMLLISGVVKKSQKYFKTQQEYLGHINGQVEEVYGRPQYRPGLQQQRRLWSGNSTKPTRRCTNPPGNPSSCPV